MIISARQFIGSVFWSFFKRQAPPRKIFERCNGVPTNGLVAHIAQTFLFGAYKQRRELVWIVGGPTALVDSGVVVATTPSSTG
jgi:hypothetical protein